MASKNPTCPMCGQQIENGQPTVTLPSHKVVHTSCAGQ